MSTILERILPKPGDVLVERYELIEEIGRGGFGMVFRAHQRGLEEDVAIKLLLPHVLSRPEVGKRFAREVQVAKGLRHPNTIRIIDVAETPEGLPFYVMEFLKGDALDHVIWEESTLSQARTRRICLQVLNSLAEAHAAGIVHRDLKPGNIVLCDIVGARDFVKVLDFGIAKALGEGGAQSLITRSDMMIGTPTYMSPEQCAGRRDIDQRSDIYAVGLIIAECLSGRPVVTGHSTLEVLTKHTSTSSLDFPRPVRASRLWEIIQRATAKERGGRYPNAIEMAEALQGLGELPEGRLNKGLLSPVPKQGPTPPPTNPGLDPTVATPLDSAELIHPESPRSIESTGEEYWPVPRSRNRVVLLSIVALLAAGVAGTALMIGGSAQDPAETTVADTATALAGAETETAEQAAPTDDAVGPTEQTSAAEPTSTAPSLSSDDMALLTALTIATERGRAALPMVRAVRFEGVEGVRVMLDGQEIGVTPFEISLPRAPRHLQLHLERRGYRSDDLTFSLLSDTVEVSLRRERGERRASPDPESEDSSPFGHTPIDRTRR